MDFSLFDELKELGWFTWLCVGVAAAVVLGVVCLAANRNRKTGGARTQTHKTQALVYGALCIALSFLLSYIKLFSMPQGGSITVASMLPLMLYAYWFGPSKGVAAGVVYGVLQFIQKPEIIHWAQPVLDYILAFGAIGLAGFFPKSLAAGIVVSGIARMFFHGLAGAIFFGEWAWEGWNVWLYGFAYNMVTVGPDVIICLIIALLPPIRKAFERIRPASAVQS